MVTLFVDRKGLTLRADSSALAFYDGDERMGTVPLSNSARVAVQELEAVIGGAGKFISKAFEA